MSEIEVGEYIRTNRGIIAKVIYIREATRYRCTSGTISHSPERYFLDNEQKHSVSSGYVKAHSKNILDIVEVGDYVNGYKVDDIENGKLIIGNTMQVVEQILEDNEIKSIVTKELFNSVMYKVGDIE